MYIRAFFFPVQIVVTSHGPGSLEPVTVNDAFKNISGKFPDKPALRVKRNGTWSITTFCEYYTIVTQAAKSLISLGLKPHHGICILGSNSPEWLISYLAGIMVTLFCIHLLYMYECCLLIITNH